MKPRAVPDYSAPFEAWWALYPRKIAKLAAWKSWSAWNCDALPEVLPALKLQLPAFCQRDPEHVPHPSTWLNQRRWEDEVPVAKAPPSATGSATRKPTPSSPGTFRALRCNLHTEKPNARWAGEAHWCPNCKEHKARTAGREGEPTSLADLLTIGGEK